MTDPNLALPALLVLGHLVADFVLQTNGKAERKREPRVLLAHTGVVLASHAAFLAPLAFVDGAPPVRALLGTAVGIAAVHAAIDAAKARRADAGTFRVFVADQALHFATLLLAAWALAGFARPPAADGGAAASVALVAAGYVANSTPASIFLGKLLHGLKMEGPVPARPAGRYIGVLERMLILTFVLLGQWAAIGFALTAKSVARFPQFKDGQDHFAEYFLAGTLASVSVAIGTGLLLRWALGIA